jgi:glycosyltransferase involved in cell wall biosynthesis
VIALSVILAAHNPDIPRLRRVLSGLRAQTIDASVWETLVVDNASEPAIDLTALSDAAPINTRVIREAELGLTPARRRGFIEANGALCVLVDDDNVLDPDYLANVVRLFDQHADVDACGGKVIAEFERRPEEWHSEFMPLLALRDFGDESLITAPSRSADGLFSYPPSAPVGAGMALRRARAQAWARSAEDAPRDRAGADLGSAGDNDIVFSILEGGGSVAYFPQLRLTHLIPSERLEAGYLERLNRGIQRSWMRVLSRHAANPWPPIASWTVPLRKAKAWLAYRAWSGPDARVRWQGACGHFEGRAT